MSGKFNVVRTALLAGAALAFVGAASSSPALARGKDEVRDCAHRTKCYAPEGVDQQTFDRGERANDDNNHNRHGRGGRGK